jgi:hypothetical protein
MTLEELKKVKVNDIFAEGEFTDDVNGCLLLDTKKTLKWIAVRGEYPSDKEVCWKIIYQPSELNIINPIATINLIKLGDTMFIEEYIKKLVPCDDEMYKHYLKDRKI